MFGNQSDSFSAQINDFKNVLIKLYQTRTKLIAEREAKRYRYVSELKAKLNSATSGIYERLFREKNYAAQNLFQHIVNMFAYALPDVSLSGQYRDQSACLYCTGGANGLSYLSPINHFLQSPYDTSTTEPAYKVYGEFYLTWPTEEILNVYLFSRLRQPLQDGTFLELSVPMTREYAEALLTDERKSDIEQFDYVSALMHEFGTLEFFKEMFALVKDIVQLTQDVLRVQFEIDSVEKDLLAFISEREEYTGVINANGILQEIRDMAEGKIPVEQLPVGTTVATTGVAQGVDENSLIVGEQEVQTLAPVTQKSWLPWAAAAAGILFLTRK